MASECLTAGSPILFLENSFLSAGFVASRLPNLPFGIGISNLRKDFAMRSRASLFDPRRLENIPVLLSAVAGYVDSCTFIGLFGLFVAQVTGSFVVAGAQLVTHDPGFLVKVLGIPFFLLGGVMTTVVVAAATERGRSACGWAFGLEGCLLACFLIVGTTAAPLHSPNGPTELVAAFFGLSAMGVQSAQVRLLMKGAASTNVMTTNTTLIAIEATQLMLAWQRIHRHAGDGSALEHITAARRHLTHLISIALGFLAGTALGALAFTAVGFWSLSLPTATMVLLSLWAAAIDRGHRVRPPA
jgi:uncharacterized membrane protein YoaK (UPF0700 family)